MPKLIYAKRTDKQQAERAKAMKTPAPAPEPVRMSYSSYEYLTGLMDMAELKLEQNYRMALSFIPPEPYDPKRPSGIDKAFIFFSNEMAKLRQVRHELLAAVQTGYRNHPEPEIRKFWGLE